MGCINSPMLNGYKMSNFHLLQKTVVVVNLNSQLLIDDCNSDKFTQSKNKYQTIPIALTPLHCPHFKCCLYRKQVNVLRQRASFYFSYINTYIQLQNGFIVQIIVDCILIVCFKPPGSLDCEFCIILPDP